MVARACVYHLDNKELHMVYKFPHMKSHMLDSYGYSQVVLTRPSYTEDEHMLVAHFSDCCIVRKFHQF